jgi:hypothetical protein
VFIYVAFRSNRPDLATVLEVRKVLRDNNFDANKLVVWSANSCPMFHCQKKQEVTPTENGAGNGTQSPATGDTLDN